MSLAKERTWLNLICREDANDLISFKIYWSFQGPFSNFSTQATASDESLSIIGASWWEMEEKKNPQSFKNSKNFCFVGIFFNTYRCRKGNQHVPFLAMRSNPPILSGTGLSPAAHSTLNLRVTWCKTAKIRPWSKVQRHGNDVSNETRTKRMILTRRKLVIKFY